MSKPQEESNTSFLGAKENILKWDRSHPEARHDFLPSTEAELSVWLPESHSLHGGGGPVGLSESKWLAGHCSVAFLPATQFLSHANHLRFLPKIIENKKTLGPGVWLSQFSA